MRVEHEIYFPIFIISLRFDRSFWVDLDNGEYLRLKQIYQGVSPIYNFFLFFYFFALRIFKSMSCLLHSWIHRSFYFQCFCSRSRIDETEMTRLRELGNVSPGAGAATLGASPPVPDKFAMRASQVHLTLQLYFTFSNNFFKVIFQRNPRVYKIE